MKKSEIVVLRLVTGEFVIATKTQDGLIQGTGERILRLEDPLCFEAFVNDGKGSIRFMPLVPLGKPGDFVDISQRDIMFPVNDPNPEIVKAYRDAISPIEIPDNMIQLPGIKK